MPQPRPRILRQGVGLAAKTGAARGVFGEIGRVDADRLEAVVERFDELAGDKVAEHRFVHHGDGRYILGDDAGGQLVIVGAPFGGLRLDDDVVLVGGVELVGQRGDDAAFAARLGDIDDLAVVGIAGAKEALEGDFCLLLGLGAHAADTDQNGQGALAKFFLHCVPP